MSTLAKIRVLFRSLNQVTSLHGVTSLPVIASQQLGHSYQQTVLAHQQKRCLSEKKVAPEKVKIKFIDRDGDPYTVNAVVGKLKFPRNRTNQEILLPDWLITSHVT